MIIDGIDYGHNCSPDIGASGWIQEDIGARNVGELVVSGLNSIPGHKGICVTPLGQTFNSVIGSLAKRCQIANNANVDRYISIHMNASDGEGHGIEIFANTANAKAIAQPILDNLVTLGLKNRGVKSDSLYVLRNTAAPAILIEICFCDSDIDRNIYDPLKIADAIVEGLTGQCSVVNKPQSPKNAILQKQIESLQYWLNIDYNAKIQSDGLIRQELYDNLASVGKIIVKDHKSHLILWIQQKLEMWGYLKKDSYNKMIYDEPTFQAVTNMQKKWERPTDGILRLETWDVFLTN